MVRFSKFKLPFELNFYFNGCQFFKEISIFGYFRKWKKSEKVGVAEKISFKNDIVLSKIGQGTDLG